MARKRRWMLDHHRCRLAKHHRCHQLHRATGLPRSRQRKEGGCQGNKKERSLHGRTRRVRGQRPRDSPPAARRGSSRAARTLSMECLAPACRSPPRSRPTTGLITQRHPPPGHVRRAFGSKALFRSRVHNPGLCSQSTRAIPPRFGSRPVNPARAHHGAHRAPTPPPCTHPTRCRALTCAPETTTPRGLWPQGVGRLRSPGGLVAGGGFEPPTFGL